MQENGADINREKTAAEQYKTQLSSAQAQLKTAQDGLAAFEGKKKPEEYEAELAKLRGICRRHIRRKSCRSSLRKTKARRL